MANPTFFKPSLWMNCLFQGWICGPGRQDACPLGERLASCCTALQQCCSHVASAIYIAGIVASNPIIYKSTSRACHIVDRANRQGQDVQTVSEVMS